MSPIAIIALLCCSSGLASPVAAFDNLVPNGHFELGGDVPDGWTSVYTQAGKLVAARDTKTSLHSHASLSLTGTDDTADGNVSAELPDVSGKQLVFDGSVRSSGPIASAQVALFIQDGDYKMIAWQTLVAREAFKEGDWAPFHVPATIPANGKHVRLILLIKGHGTVWLGEISANAVGEDAKQAAAASTSPTVPPTPRGPDSPKLVGISAIAPDVLEIAIHSGHVTPSKISLYQPMPGDQQVQVGHHQVLKRNGQEIGWLDGVNHDHLVTYEHLVGDPLQGEFAGWTGSYVIASPDDPAYASSQKPITLFRKSKPDDWEQPGQRFAMDHRIYLQLPHSLVEGKKYKVDFGSLNVATPSATFVFDPAKLVSEAVHISQVGYRPDDPFKRAYLSCWRGTGGGQDYSHPLTFHLIDTKTGQTVFKGPVKTGKNASEPEHMVREENFVKADVCWMDFTALSKPGSYRVVVDGIGSSFDFPIAQNVWDTAFKIQMRGLINERSGIELKPPYADFVRPADQMPNLGQAITESTYVALGGQENFDALAKGDTGKPVPGAFGGYHDAGDWNPRRVTHLKVTMAHLELLDIFPEHFKSLKLTLPDASNLPDVLQEALWEIDLFKRLQKPDGGIPYGLETHGDPEDGDVSWLTTMHLYEFAPDSYGSWTYAAAAALAARLMERYDAPKAAIYKKSAVRAMEWAEAHMAEERSQLSWEKIDARNLAAVEVYWLTKDPKWHEVFLQDTSLKSPSPNLFQYGKAVQRDAAFVYARLPNGLGNSEYKQNAKDGLEALAKKALVYAEGNAFNLTSPDKGKPFIVGFYTEADASDLCRAHYFTHKPEYLAGVVRACQFSTGANPSNLAYTTGLGVSPIKNPLLLDSRRSGQPAPKGLTVYGPIDFILFHDDGITWPIKYFLNTACIPPASTWPIPEAYYDIYLYPMINEFTVDIWAGNVYAWGYLAGRS